jgi:hydrogenase maturation protease
MSTVDPAAHAEASTSAVNPAASAEASTSAVVIGVGNPYRSDDGVGPNVVNLLRDKELRGAALECSLGETADLIECWAGAPLAILVDAIRARPAHPGRIHHLVVPDVHTERIRAASSHGIDLGEAIELARVLDRLPGRLELFAVEVDNVDLGLGLSAPVTAAARRVAQEIHAMLTAPAVP